jgi:sulfhydrogenase subunit beta (sulfur reductase)
MNQHILKKEELDAFIKKLSKRMKVVAPVAKGYDNFAFAEVTSADEISLKYVPTILPPKKYFMPVREKVLEFSADAKGFEQKPVVEYEETAIFGVHTCDLAGISCLNMVFSERPRDYNYLTRKDHLFIIGLECLSYCDEHASCALVNAHNPNGGYDLFFTDLGDKWIIHVNTQKGEDLVEGIGLPKASAADLSQLEKVRAAKREVFKNEIGVEAKQLPGIFSKAMKSPVWHGVGERCVSCGNCTNVCPTCYCFDMTDSVGLDLRTGERTRTWDSCQFETFAKVAGNENFREERSERQRHRYFRKFSFPLDKFNRFFCTGCGRCTRTCMAKINLKETLKSLAAEHK